MPTRAEAETVRTIIVEHLLPGYRVTSVYREHGRYRFAVMPEDAEDPEDQPAPPP